MIGCSRAFFATTARLRMQDSGHIGRASPGYLYGRDGNGVKVDMTMSLRSNMIRKGLTECGLRLIMASFKISIGRTLGGTGLGDGIL